MGNLLSTILGPARTVQVYDGSETKATKLFSENLKNELDDMFGNVILLHVGTNEISRDPPLLVLCHNYSRIGTDIDHATQALKGIEYSKTVVVVIHMKEPHALPVTMPTENLTDDKYTRFGQMVDFAFTPDQGLYQCNINARGRFKLEMFLKDYMAKPTRIAQWISPICRNPKKIVILIIITIMTMGYMEVVHRPFNRQQ